MADISVTAANVQPGTATPSNGFFGATVTAGQSVYLDSSTNTYKLADADLSAAAANCAGIALNGGSSGQPATVAVDGPYTVGGTVVVGKVYVVSATAGGIAPSTDLATGMWTTVLGVGISATQISLKRQVSGVQVP